MEINICKVKSVSDINGGDRVTVLLRDVKFGGIHERQAFPVLPKMLHVKPKVGELVMVFDDGGSQIYYMGPIIPQLQYMEYSSAVRASTGLETGLGSMSTALMDIPEAKGAEAEDDEIAVYGRKNTDIILSDNDIRIRSGVRITDGGQVTFNRKSPSFLKLEYHTSPILAKQKNPLTKSVEKEKSVDSTATLVAQEINLISTDGNPYFNVTNQTEKSISEEELKKIIEAAHALPYGDKLIEFLDMFITAFATHYHQYPLLPPAPTREVVSVTGFDLPSLLSKNVRIN